MPRGLDFMMRVNVDARSLPPDALYAQRAMRWTQAEADQRAYQDATDDVRQEAAGFDRLAHARPAEAG